MKKKKKDGGGNIKEMLDTRIPLNFRKVRKQILPKDDNQEIMIK